MDILKSYSACLNCKVSCKLFDNIATVYCIIIIGTQNYLLTVCKEYSEAPDPPGTVEFLEMAQCLMSTHNLTFPKKTEEAVNLYVTMTTILDNSIIQ